MFLVALEFLNHFVEFSQRKIHLFLILTQEKWCDVWNINHINYVLLSTFLLIITAFKMTTETFLLAVTNFPVITQKTVKTF